MALNEGDKTTCAECGRAIDVKLSSKRRLYASCLKAEGGCGAFYNYRFVKGEGDASKKTGEAKESPAAGAAADDGAGTGTGIVVTGIRNGKRVSVALGRKRTAAKRAVRRSAEKPVQQPDAKPTGNGGRVRGVIERALDWL